MTGYSGAKAMCAASTGCGSSSSAHMCTGEEIARSAQLGINPPTGWYSSYNWILTAAPGAWPTCNLIASGGRARPCWAPSRARGRDRLSSRARTPSRCCAATEVRACWSRLIAGDGMHPRSR
jgi:hypothetical protein